MHYTDGERRFNPDGKVLCGDCATILRQHVPSNSIDLIVTSPPYGMQRAGINGHKASYGGIAPEDYCRWFLVRAQEFQRVLKPSGSLVLNIKESAVKGERQTYVLELILDMRRQDWLWVDEIVWAKKNCYRGHWPNRLADAWERCLHFTKKHGHYFNPEAVSTPVKESSKDRWGKEVRRGVSSQSQSGFVSWTRERGDFPDMARPTNVLHLACETRNRAHPATFPEALPEFFINLLCPPDGMVLDPFAGSGTTGVVAQRLGRDFILIDKVADYCRKMQERLQQ